METTNENIRQLLEMLDHPEAYTEQEIHDIINRDEDTRETYRLMVEAKRSSRNRHDDTPVDVDDAWQRFAKKQKSRTPAQRTPDRGKRRYYFLFLRTIAAAAAETITAAMTTEASAVFAEAVVPALAAVVAAAFVVAAAVVAFGPL